MKLTFLIKPFFLYDQWIKTKNLNVLRIKRPFKIKKKSFFINFNRLSLKQIKPFFGRWKSDYKPLQQKIKQLGCKFRSFVTALFDMLGLGRKLILETFNKWGFFNDFLYQSRHSVMCWAKGKFSNSCKPNIWEFYKVLVQVTFATSQTKLMSNRENFVDEFDSQAAKQIKS